MTDLKKYESTFCRQTKNLVVALQNSLENKDLKECLGLFHTLKGSAAMMECRGLQNFAEMAEKMVKSSENISELKSSCREIEHLARNFNKLKKWCHCER